MKNSVKFCKNNKIMLFVAATIFMAVAFVLGIFCGSSKVLPFDILSGDETALRIIKYVRFPRVLATLLCGAAFSVSGAVIQNVLSNKIASPSIIGVNSGAGLMVTICAAMGLYGGWQLSLFAFLGALAATLLVSIGGEKFAASRSGVILTGVAINALFGAFSDFIITLNPEIGVMSNDFKIGDFSAVTYEKLVPAMVIILASLFVLFTLKAELDIICLGDENASGLGLNTKFMRTVFLIFSSLLCGCAVSVAGLVSFVGLMVPHIVRKFGATSAKHLLPLCAAFGAGFVCICDTGARVLFAPYEIPVGIIMAFLGAPFFVFILIKRKGGHKND